jgi:hypothetical protein
MDPYRLKWTIHGLRSLRDQIPPFEDAVAADYPGVEAALIVAEAQLQAAIEELKREDTP